MKNDHEETSENNTINRFVDNIMTAITDYNKSIMSERVKAGIKKARLERQKVFVSKN